MKGIRILSFICVMLLGLRIQSFANSQNENDSVLIAKKNFNIVYTNDIDLCSDLVNVNFVKAFQHRAFSNAVVTQNRQKLSRVHIKVHVFENRRSALVVVGKIFNAQHFRSPPLNRR